MGQGEMCKYKLGNLTLHHALRMANTERPGSGQCVSYRLVLFAGFGVFISLPSPPPLNLHNLDLGRFGFTFVPVEPERVVSIDFLPHYAKVAKTP